MQPNRRYVELDGLRGIAAGAVVLYHLFDEFDVYFRPATPAPVVRFSQGYYGVHLFFLISGLVILLTARSVSGPRDYVVARFSRLYPTYWVCLTLSWAVVLALGVSALYRSPFEVAVNYSMVQRILGVRSVDGAYWSLSVEMVFYGLVWLLLVTGSELRATTVRRVVPLWLLTSIGVAVLVHLRPDDGAVGLLGVLTIAEFAPLVCLGMLLLSSREAGRLDVLVLPALAAAWAISTLFRGWSNGIVVTAIAAAFTAVVMLPGCPPLRWRPLVFVGEISYPLYLVHQNLGYAVLDRLVGRVDRTLASLAALVVVAVVAWILHRAVEGPVSRWVRRTLGGHAERRSTTSSGSS